MKILTVVGARPQFIKAAALSKAIGSNDAIREVILHTGQHFDENMSDVFFKEMQIPKPKYQLSVNGLNHGAMTGRMLEGIEEALLQEKPDCLLVYGDTNSTLAGALAAKKLHIRVAHVEAGLRSFNMNMPEEVNRILTDRISDFLFCPTDTAVENLKREGFEHFKCLIENTGDIMYDSMLLFSEYAREHAVRAGELASGRFVLCTIHRAENTDDEERLNSIVKALNEIAADIRIILPLHPRTRQKMGNISLNPNIIVTEPLGYFDMLALLDQCSFVMTDSGGLQKEAYFNGKFCITLRDETEWTELVTNGYNFIAGASAALIAGTYFSLKDAVFPAKKNLYGDGRTAYKILDTIIKNISQ